MSFCEARYCQTNSSLSSDSYFLNGASQGLAKKSLSVMLKFIIAALAEINTGRVIVTH